MKQKNFPTMRLLTFCLLLGCFTLSNSALLASSWTGMGQTGDWNDAGNWSPQSVPGPGDAAYIHNASPYVSTNITVGSLILDNASLSGPGTMTVVASFSADSASCGVPLTLIQGCAGQFTGYYSLGNVLTNYGEINCNAQITWFGNDFINYGTFNAVSGYGFGIYYSPARFLNHGIFKKSFPSGTFNAGVEISNFEDGDILVQQGELNIFVLKNYGDAVVSSGAVLRCNNATQAYDNSTFTGAGTYIIEGNGFFAYNSNPISIDITETQLKTNVLGSGTVVFTQHLNWLAGEMGTIVNFAAGSIVDVNNFNDYGHGITGTVNNYGTLNINYNMTFSYGGIVNYNLLLLNGPYAIGIYAASAGIINHGIVKKPVNSDGTFHMNIQLDNQPDGDVLIQNGELNVSVLYNHGDVNVSAGAFLRSNNGTQTYDNSTITGAGTYVIEGNGLSAANANPVSIDIAVVDLTSSIGLNGSVTFTQHVVWTGGTLGAPVTFSASCVVDLNPGNGLGITATAINYGTMNVNAGITMSYGGIENHGLILLNGPYSIGIYAASSGIDNFGTVKKPASSGGVFTMNIPLTNEAGGSVVIEGGELNVSVFYNHSTASVASGAILRVNNATLLYDGATFSGAGTFIAEGNAIDASNTTPVIFDIAETELHTNLSGSGPVVLSAHVSWFIGTISTPTNITATAVIDLVPGAYNNNYGVIELYGVMNCNAPLTGGGILNNHNLINLNAPGYYGDGTINNTGQILKNASAGDVTFGMLIINNGTIECLSDNLFFNGGLVNSGIINVAAGANAQTNGYGNFSLETGSQITGSGSFTHSSNMAANADLSIDIQTFISENGSFSGTGVLTFLHTYDCQGVLAENTIAIASGAVMNIPNTGSGLVLYGTLTNNGTVNCNANIQMDYNAVINNNAEFNLGDATYVGSFYYYYNSISGQFNNAGTLNLNPASTLYFSTLLNNLPGGTLNAVAGTTELGKLDNDGTISIASGAALVVKDGTNLPNGVVNGTGTLRISGNGWALSNSLIVNTYTIEIYAPLSGSGVSLDISGTGEWFAGNLSIPVNILATGVFNINAYGYKILMAPLTNAGTVNVHTYFSTQADINTSGTFNFQDTNGGAGFYGYGGETFTNTGNVYANIGSTIGAQALNNGTIAIGSSGVEFSHGLTNNAAVTIAAGALMNLSDNSTFNAGSSVTGPGSIGVNGALTLNLDFTFSGENFQLNGDLLGPDDLTINSAMQWFGGNIQTDVTIANGATLEIGNGGGGNNSKSAAKSSSYGQTLSAIITNNGATTQTTSYGMDNGTFINNGQITMFGCGINDAGAGGTFTNNGDWAVNYYLNLYVNSTNNGTLRGESNPLIFEPALVNNGTVSPGFSPGEMVFAHNYENGAELDMEVESSAGPGTGHDYILAHEDIVLGGALVVTETGSPLDGTYVILHSDGSLNGTFASVSLPAGYTIDYTGNEVILTRGVPATVTPSDTTICSGNSVTLTASAGDTYQWSTGETTQSIDVYPYNETSYYVTVTSGGNGSMGNATVHVNPAPYLYVDPGYAYLCQGESVTITAYSDNVTYAWSTGETTQSIVVNPTTTETYMVTVTAPGGCTAVSGSTIYGTTNTATPVTLTDPPPSTICQNDYAYLYTYQGGISGYWTGPGVYYGYYFEGYNLSGPQVLTFNPYSGQCSTPATWTIDVQNGTWYEDADGDGYGNPNSVQYTCTQPSGYVADNTDCDDTNAAVHPGAAEVVNGIDDNCNGQIDENSLSTFYADADGDTYGDPNSSIQAATAPAGYVSDNTDCDDTNAAVHPGATEICNGIDDNCNGLTDNADPGITGQSTWYADTDGDGFGNPAVSQLSCIQPNAYVSDNTDCDDSNPAVHPGATEVCNGIDDDCNGLTDNSDPGITGQSIWYADADGDGYGNASASELSCIQPGGYVSNNIDCDDTNAAVHPGATEICNGIDDDCDGLTDSADPGVTGQPTWYADADGDGFGNSSVTQLACTQPAGYVSDNTDCNDNNANVHPGATEICNSLDDDCDGQVDEGLGFPWYADVDGDGYGDPSVFIISCMEPDGYSIYNTDCDDDNVNVHPGATETCNGIDDDCDGLVDEGVGSTWYADADGDGFGNAAVSTTACTQPTGYVADNTDCNDTNAAVHPGATEICNGLDDDCDGLVDEGVGTIWYADADGDGFGNAAVSTTACTQPLGYVANNTDCNDGSAGVHPGATEACNGIDDDCDGLVDEGVGTIWYADADGDGYGNASVSTTACTQPAGYVADYTDCNDANADVHPGATETCNGLDDDCDGQTDEGLGTTWYADADGDGYGIEGLSVTACTQPLGYVDNHDDCDDSNASVHPGATEICINGIDDDCDGQVDETTLGLNASAGTILCYGGSTLLSASAAGGTTPYQYKLDAGAYGSASTFTVTAGNHTVTVKDANACTVSISVSIAQPAPIVIAPINVTNVGCNGGNTGAIDISVSGGTAPYSYHWSNNKNTQDILGLAAGTYTVTVTSAGGCTTTASATVNPKLNLVVTKTNTSCPNGDDGTAIATATGGTPSYSYIWSNGETTSMISGLTPGAYTVTVFDALGCTRIKTISVAQPAAMVITGIVAPATCNGSASGSITVNVNNGALPFNYTWSDGGNTKDRVNLIAGIYTVTVTDNNSCTKTKSFTIAQPTAINLTTSINDASCDGSMTLIASVSGGNAPYQFSFDGSIYSATNNTPVTAGIHTVSVKDAHNCVVSNTLTVNAWTPIVVAPITITNVTCAGGNTGAIDISVSGGLTPYTYHWSNNRTTEDNLNIGAGTYTVTVTGAGGCSVTASATVNPKLALTMSKTNTTCYAGDDGTATAHATAGTPAYSYVWSTGATTATITGLTTGTYTVTLTDALGCTRAAAISIAQPAQIGIAGVVTAAACNGSATGSVNLTITNGTAPFSFAWSDGGTTEDRTGLTAGTYTVTVTDVNGCNREKTFPITQPTALILSFATVNVSCNGAADGEITATANGGVKFPTSSLCNGERYCYDWSNGETSRINSDLGPGTYMLNVTDANGCTINGTAVITQPDPLEISNVQVELQSNGKYKLTVTGAGGTTPYKYRRTPGSAGFQTSNIFTNLPAGAYQLTIRDKNLCEETVSVNVPGGMNFAKASSNGDQVDVFKNGKDFDPSGTVQVYPNPASEVVNIEISQVFNEAEVRVFDVQGRLVAAQSLEAGTASLQLRVGDWQSGLYVVQILVDGEQTIRKLAIERQ